jgi:hypothetical protein
MAVLGFGFWAISFDGICLDPGEDPACEEGGGNALSMVQASSWVLAAGAGAAFLLALQLAFRLRRPAQVVPVLLLCLVVGGIGQVLWDRL